MPVIRDLSSQLEPRQKIWKSITYACDILSLVAPQPPFTRLDLGRDWDFWIIKWLQIAIFLFFLSNRTPGLFSLAIYAVWNNQAPRLLCSNGLPYWSWDTVMAKERWAKSTRKGLWRLAKWDSIDIYSLVLLFILHLVWKQIKCLMKDQPSRDNECKNQR